jgi:uncharacterized membrane protein YeaQ/YmgE (transglycosylase-associated protein family)
MQKGERTYMLLWIFVGLVAGWLTGRSLEGEGYRRSMDIVMGIAVALIGGALMGSNGFPGSSDALPATIVAMICAVTLTTLTALGNGRKAFAHLP